jgi:hypothetical protein
MRFLVGTGQIDVPDVARLATDGTASRRVFDLRRARVVGGFAYHAGNGRHAEDEALSRQDLRDALVSDCGKGPLELPDQVADEVWIAVDRFGGLDQVFLALVVSETLTDRPHGIRGAPTMYEGQDSDRSLPTGIVRTR